MSFTGGEEGDPTKLGAGSDFGGAGSGYGLFRHKLNPEALSVKLGVYLLIYGP